MPSPANLRTSVKLLKCGNSLVVSVPASIISFLGLKAGDKAKVKLDRGAKIVYSFKVQRQLNLIKIKSKRHRQTYGKK